MAKELCFDVVSKAINERTEESGHELVVDEQNLSALRECCSVVDVLVDKFQGRDISATVMEKSGNLIQVNFILKYLCIGNNKNIFYYMMDNVCACKFYCREDDSIMVSLAFPSVWSE